MNKTKHGTTNYRRLMAGFSLPFWDPILTEI